MIPPLSRHRRLHACAPRSRQRGIALLVAILLVALGTVIAAAVAYDNAMTARRGVATFAFDQNILIAQGAEALAAFLLREVHRHYPNSTDFTQPWAQPPTPFEIAPGVMLEGSLEDMAGRFNINLLVDPSTDQPNPAAREAFINLLQTPQIDIEPEWADKIIDWIDFNATPMAGGAEDSVYLGQDPPYLTASHYISSITELLALPGFGRDRYMKLAPYIAALPPQSKINVCTAPGKVLDAFIGPGHSDWDNDQLAKNRTAANGCFPSLTKDLRPTFPDQNTFNKATANFVQTSNYFRLTSHVTIGSVEFNLYSLLYLDTASGNVRPIMRSYSPD
jgi:general secretion pathway protein K